MLRIRMVQERIELDYVKDEMKTPIHLCIGQEAVAAGVCANLTRSDYICSNHRGHGHYLAKGGDLKSMIAELHCRKTGCSKGHGGSMHLVDTSVGHIGSSSIVGGGIAIAVGLALAIRMRNQNRVSVVFFSDGAADEGVLYESVNFAILKKLPVAFIYENNEYSCCSHIADRQSGEVLFHAASPESIYTAAVDGNSVKEIWEAVKIGVDHAREGKGPAFIECRTYRIRGHAGSGSDTGLGYRTEREVQAWDSKCPVQAFRRELLAERIITEEEIDEMAREIDLEIDEAFRFAEQSPLPEKEELFDYLYSEE